MITASMTEVKHEVALSDIYKAKARIKEFFLCTPCTKTCLSEDSGIEVTLKEENLSPTGSYFDRAILNSLLVLPEDQRRRGVITASECRPFIRALFHYGPKVGVPVTLVIPLGSQIQKQMLSQPGRVIVCCGNDIIEAKRYAEELARGVRLEFIDSEHSHTLLTGLGTLFLEIVDQCGSNFDAILVPYNEKILLKALRCSAKSIFPHVQVIGVHEQQKEITLVCSSPNTSTSSQAVLNTSDAGVSQPVLRVFDKWSVLLSKEGVSRLPAVISTHLPQLRGKKVVVVSSESLAPRSLQLPQLINKGPAA